MKAQLWFYKAPGKFFDKVIKWWTKSRYSHVEVVVDGVACAADAWSGKVRSMPVIQFNIGNWDIVEIELQKDLAWLYAQKDKKYDWLGILGFITFKKLQDRNKWYCSELAAAALGMSNEEVSPGELYDRVTGETA